MSVDSERQRAGVLIDAGRAAEALRILGPLLAAQPEDAISLRLVAMAHAKLGTQEKSLEAAEASTRVSPDNDLSWRLVASAASALGRHDEATAAAERARALGPGTWRNHYIVVMVAAGAHAPPETARVSVREVLRLAPLEPDAHFAAAYYSSAGADCPQRSRSTARCSNSIRVTRWPRTISQPC